MLQDMDYKLHSSIRPQLFSKKPLLQISKLKNYHGDNSAHIVKDKLSDKMDRRDVTFYDLYKLHKPDESVNLLAHNHYPLENVLACGSGEAKDDNEEEKEEGEKAPVKDLIYGDIEVDDFNTLFKNPNLIEDRFGESISVIVKFDKKTGAMERNVQEDLTKVKEKD